MPSKQRTASFEAIVFRRPRMDERADVALGLYPFRQHRPVFPFWNARWRSCAGEQVHDYNMRLRAGGRLPACPVGLHYLARSERDTTCNLDGRNRSGVP